MMTFRSTTELPPRDQWILVGEFTRIKPDREEAERFLAALDPSATTWTFQVFDDNADRKSLKLAHILHGSLDRCWAELCQLSAAGAGIFVCVNETDGKGRSAANIVRVRACFVDLDKGEPLPAKFHVEPHIIVESSRSKWHVYWRVEGCTIDQFRTLQERLIQFYKSDAAVKDPSRVLRLPGFIHQKVKKGVRSTPFRTRLVEAHADA
jgi:putative DNA primase/helicase